jgi:hypothetical protein
VDSFAEVSGQAIKAGVLKADSLTVSEFTTKTRRFHGSLLEMASPQDAVHLEARILTRDGKGRRRRFLVNHRTFFDESRASAQSGQRIEIRAEQQADGSWLARYVRFYRE